MTVPLPDPPSPVPPRPGLEVFPVAIGSYTDPGHTDLTDHPQHNVATEVAAIADLFEQFGGYCVDWDTPMPNRTHDQVSRRLTRWTLNGRARTVLYWVGHGWSNGQDAALAHASSPKSVRHLGITPFDLAGFFETHPVSTDDIDDAWAIVIIDTCQSAKFVQLLDAQINQRLHRRRFLLIGVSPHGATTLGQFSTTLRTILSNTFRADTEIPLWDLAKELRRTLPADAEAIPKQIDHAVLRRTHQPMLGAPIDVIDEIENALAALTEDERRHFIPKAQGGELGEQTWYFEGRHTETHDIITWLETQKTGLLVITGAAGAGKSALMGHLITQSHPPLRDALARHGLRTTTSDNGILDNAFDAVLHLTGLTTMEIVRRLAAAAGLGTVPDSLSAAVVALTEGITRRGPLTIAVDALDEAVDPLIVAHAVLRTLARLPTIRIVVGTRRSTQESPDQPHPTDCDLLDALGADQATVITVATDAKSIGRYVHRRLTTAVNQQRLTAQPDDIDDASVAIGSSGRHFLFACLAVHEIIANPSILTPRRIDDLLSANHQYLFATAVDRLTQRTPNFLALLRALAFARGRGLPIRDGIWTCIATALQPATAPRETPADDTDITALLTVAAPYLMLDREHGQTVYRLAHRTFAEHFTNETSPTPQDRHTHHAIMQHLIAHAEQTPSTQLNAYTTYHLTAHAAVSGEPAWNRLANHTTVLDRLDSRTTAADAMRTAFGHFSLPAPIAGIIGASHKLATAEPRDRSGLRQLAMIRHTDIHTPARTEPYRTRHWSVLWAHYTRHTPTHLTLIGHTGWVTGVAVVLMPDGQVLLATTSSDRTVRLWDPTTGSPVGDPLTGHTDWVRAVEAVPMPDGRVLLATTSEDRTVRLWDPAIGDDRVGDLLTSQAGLVRAVVAVPMPDGRVLLATSSDKGQVRLWDPTTGNPVHKPLPRYAGAVLAAAPMPDGRILLAFKGHRCVELWDLNAGSASGDLLTGQTDRLRAAAVPMPDGQVLLATAGDNGPVQLWDAKTGFLVSNVRTGHTGAVFGLAAVPMPNGQVLLATAGDDRTVQLWDPKTGFLESDERTGHTGAVFGLAAVPMPNGQVLLATAGKDETVRFWDTVTRREIYSIYLGSIPTAIAYLGKERFAVAIEDSVTVLSLKWDLA